MLILKCLIAWRASYSYQGFHSWHLFSYKQEEPPPFLLPHYYPLLLPSYYPCLFPLLPPPPPEGEKEGEDGADHPWPAKETPGGTQGENWENNIIRDVILCCLFLSCHLCSTFAMGTLLGQGTCPGTSQIHSRPFLLFPKLAGLYSASCWACLTWDLMCVGCRLEA